MPANQAKSSPPRRATPRQASRPAPSAQPSPLDEIGGLVSYARRAAAASTIDEILAITVDETCRLLQARAAGIWFVDATRTLLTPSTGLKNTPSDAAGTPLRIVDYPELGRALSQQAPLVIERGALPKAFSYGTLLLVPLLSRGRHFGLLLADFRATKPTAATVRLAGGLGAQAGLAIAGATHLGQLRDALEQERRSANSVIRGSADGILSIDDDERITLFNPAMETLVGYGESEVLGRTCSEVFDAQTEDGKALDFSNLGHVTPSGEIAPVRNAAIKTRSGEKRWVGITASPEREADNHIIVVMRDISEQFELQQRQREFVAIASHELRTPITALVGYLSLLEGTAAAESSESARYVKRAGDAANRLSELIEDLLNVARIEEGRLTLNTRPLDPRPVVAEVLRNLEPSIERKELSVTVNDRLTPHDTIRADRSKLSQILQNLIENAVKYTTPGGRITISTRPAEGQVCLAIKDSGIGIRPENLSRIYEKFFREYTELSVGAGGTGLGLFITKELVERQGGALRITAEPNRGTLAEVRFPLVVKS